MAQHQSSLTHQLNGPVGEQQQGRAQTPVEPSDALRVRQMGIHGVAATSQGLSHAQYPGL